VLSNEEAIIPRIGTTGLPKCYELIISQFEKCVSSRSHSVRGRRDGKKGREEGEVRLN